MSNLNYSKHLARWWQF